MPEVDDNSVDCIITSPPYWGLRDYGSEANQVWPDGWHGQLGLEPTLSLYLDHLFLITAECKRVLKPTGVMWWNHGDCYSAKRWSDTPSTTGISRKCSDIVVEKIHGLPDKCMVLQNYRLILRLIDEQGWILRNDVKWHKPNGMPSSVKDRLANKHEPVFMLVKQKRYWFDLDAIREKYTKPLDRWGGDNLKVKKIPCTCQENKGKTNMIRGYWDCPKCNGTRFIKVGSNWDNGTGQTTYRDRDMRPDKSGKNPGDIWTIPTQPYPEAHFATFPEKLIIKPILSSCPEWICRKCGKARVRITKKDQRIRQHWAPGTEKKTEIAKGKHGDTSTLVSGYKFTYKTIGWSDCQCSAGWRPGITLDPFAGSGTTLAMAKRYNRQYIGYEISKKYIPLSNKRIAKEDTFFNKDN